MNVQEKDTLAPVIDLDVLEKNIARLLISLEEEKATSGRAQLVTWSHRAPTRKLWNLWSLIAPFRRLFICICDSQDNRLFVGTAKNLVPMGRPSVEKPQGIDMAASPVKLSDAAYRPVAILMRASGI
jgi:hypothetical protein